MKEGLGDVIRRMDAIYTECGGGSPKPPKRSAPEVLVDDFSVARLEIHEQVIHLRALIKERDEKQVAAGDKFSERIVRLGQEVRQCLKDVTADVDELSAMHHRNATRRRKDFMEAELEEQAAVVELCRRHLTEVELLDKQRYAELRPKARARTEQTLALFTGVPVRRLDPTETGLPEITGTLADGLAVVANQEAAIDDKLDTIGEGLAVVKEQQRGIGDELAIQMGGVLATVEADVDATQASLDTASGRARALLRRVKTNDRVLIYAIMILLVVALLVWLANMVANFGWARLKASVDG